MKYEKNKNSLDIILYTLHSLLKNDETNTNTLITVMLYNLKII